MTNFELLLFDADETLFDFNKAMRVSICRCLNHYGIRCSENMLKTYDKINIKYWYLYENGAISRPQMQKSRFVEFLSQYNLDCDPGEFDRLYIENLAYCPFLYDGVESLCEDLSKHYRMSIVTNGIAYMQRKRIKSSTIEKHFEHIIISDDAGAPKPEKGFFDYVFSIYGDVPRTNALIIGDSLAADMKGGSIAGISTCWFNPGKLKNDLNIKINYEVQSIEQLRKLLLY